jgi:hypothetical protein
MSTAGGRSAVRTPSEPLGVGQAASATRRSGAHPHLDIPGPGPASVREIDPEEHDMLDEGGAGAGVRSIYEPGEISDII